MLKKFKHITTIVLLVVIPISAIGLNISIHKCKHMDTIHISFFSSSKNHSNSDCCGSTCNSEVANNHHNKNCTRTNEDMNTCSVGTKPNVNHSNSESCEISTIEKEKTKSPVETRIPDGIPKGFEFINNPCCSNSELSYNFDFSILNSDKINLFPEHQFLLHSNFQGLIQEIKDLSTLTVKDVNYPLKEPISEIISFIHFTSQNGDDPDVPVSLYC